MPLFDFYIMVDWSAAEARVSRSIEVVIRSGAAQKIFLHSHKGGRPHPHAFVR
jgi:hypothetical protein